jgi:FAD:protein FMN transferase
VCGPPPGDGWRIATGDGSLVAVGDSSPIAVGDGSRVAVGDGSRVAIGDGLRIAVGDDHPFAGTDPAVTATIRSGGLATSGIASRTWRRAGRTLHHIVDPRTGDLPEAVWRTATVAAGSCVDANTASTAAIVMGWEAPGWLGAANLPTRLVCCGGTVLTIAGWPADDETGPMP